MNNESFYEILAKKLLENESISSASSASSASTQPPTPSHFQQNLNSEALWNQFFSINSTVNFTAKANPSAAKKYPKSTRPANSKVISEPAVAAAATTTKPMAEKVEIEKWVLKSSLEEDGLAKWNLFEKTFSQHFSEKLTARQARSTYRKFIKKIHPDQTGEKSEYNFSTLVKIKDELISVLEKHIADQS